MADKIVRSHSDAGKAVLPKRFLTDLSRVFAKEGYRIYQGRNEVRVVPVNERKIVIKKYGKPPIFNRIFYSLGIRVPKSVRSYKNAQEILARGFRTPQPLAQEIHYHNGLLGDSYFVSEWAEGRSLAAVRKTGTLVRSFARYTAQLHEAGMMHRDYILSNVLFTMENNRFKFELIDINRFIFQKGPLDYFHVCVNLMQPFHEDRRIRVFVTTYARARQMDEKKLVLWVLRFRHLRNRYSQLKKWLRKLPGAHYFTRKAEGRRRRRR